MHGAVTKAGVIARWRRDPMVRAVWALGITEIISWGTMLYVLGVLGGPIAADTGWSRSLVFGGLSVGLIVSSLASTYIGRLIDRHGGRPVLTAGSALGAVGLAAAALAPSEIAYLAAWALVGVAMRMTLYDAAFAALVQVAPERGRRAISLLTLFGGFASSVFWPIGYALMTEFGWRGTLFIFAALNLLVAVPLNWWGLSSRTPPRHVDPEAVLGAEMVPATQPAHVLLTGRARLVAIVLFSIVASGGAFVFGAMSVHLPAVLQAGGLTAAAAVTLASIKGVAQVVGRVWELTFAHRLHPLTVARVSTAIMPLSFVVLMLWGTSFAGALAFTVMFGIANGLLTIVRGAVPLALFGSNGYGELLGVLAAPYLLVNALAPAALAIVIDHWDYATAEAVVLAAGLLSLVAMELMALWYWRLTRAAVQAP